MPTPTKGRRLGGSPAHEKLMMANLATSLFEHGRITTTEAKARRVRPLAEKLITKAKRGDLHNRRQIQRVVKDKDVVHRLMAEIGPFYEDRPGGYTRIVKTLPRKGDNAAMAVIELVPEKTVTSEAERARGTRFARDEPSQGAGGEAAAGEAAAGEAAEAVPAADAPDVEQPHAEIDEFPEGDGTGHEIAGEAGSSAADVVPETAEAEATAAEADTAEADDTGDDGAGDATRKDES